MRDAQGRSLLYPGRSHPLTRRVIARVRAGQCGRVSAARGAALSLLVTYGVEIGDLSGILLRTLSALLLTPDAAFEQPADILALAGQAVPPDRLWSDRFAGWAPEALKAADVRAAAVAARIADDFARSWQEKQDRDAATLGAWLTRRTNALCGAPVDPMGDLFDTVPRTDDWRCSRPPQQRLAAFAADMSVPMPQRREAAHILTRVADVTGRRAP